MAAKKPETKKQRSERKAKTVLNTDNGKINLVERAEKMEKAAQDTLANNAKTLHKARAEYFNKHTAKRGYIKEENEEGNPRIQDVYNGLRPNETIAVKDKKTGDRGVVQANKHGQAKIGRDEKGTYRQAFPDLNKGKGPKSELKNDRGLTITQAATIEKMNDVIENNGGKFNESEVAKHFRNYNLQHPTGEMLKQENEKRKKQISRETIKKDKADQKRLSDENRNAKQEERKRVKQDNLKVQIQHQPYKTAGHEYLHEHIHNALEEAKKGNKGPAHQVLGRTQQEITRRTNNIMKPETTEGQQKYKQKIQETRGKVLGERAKQWQEEGQRQLTRQKNGNELYRDKDTGYTFLSEADANHIKHEYINPAKAREQANKNENAEKEWQQMNDEWERGKKQEHDERVAINRKLGAAKAAETRKRNKAAGTTGSAPTGFKNDKKGGGNRGGGAPHIPDTDFDW